MSNASDFMMRGSLLKQYTGTEKRVTIPDSVKMIGATAFANCSSVEEIIVPKTVEIIRGAAFYSCKRLKHLLIQGAPEIQAENYGAYMSIESENALHSAGPIGSGCDYEYGWTEKIPVGAFMEMDRIILPIELKELPENAVRYCDNTVFICPGKTFSLLPTKYKLASAIRWLCGEDELDEVQQNTITPFIKRAKDKCFSALLEKHNVQGIVRLLSVTAPSLDKLDNWIDQCNDRKQTEELAALMNYKASVFSTEQVEKHAQKQTNKELGVEKKTLSDWRKVYRLSEISRGYIIQKYKLDEEEVTIPETIADKKVICIGKEAFAEKKGLRSVYIPDSIKEMDVDAFRNCVNLERIRLPEKMKTIGEGTFAGCVKLISIRLPDGIKELPDRCLSGCHSLREIFIPESVARIGDYAVNYCEELTQVQFPGALTEIGNCAFADCKKAVFSSVPESVIKIGSWAFYRSCFSDRSMLTRKGNISADAFAHCPQMADSEGFVIIQDRFDGYYGDAETIRIPDGIRTIAQHAFADGNQLEEIILPESIEQIERCAFSDCTALKELVLPGLLKKVGEYAFPNAPTLTSLVFKAEKVSLSYKAFAMLQKDKVTIYAPDDSTAAALAEKTGLRREPIISAKD